MNTPTKEDRKKPVSFSQWFLKVIRHFEEKGVEFDRIKSGLVKIQLPGHLAILRTFDDFEREYLSKFSL